MRFRRKEWSMLSRGVEALLMHQRCCFPVRIGQVGTKYSAVWHRGEMFMNGQSSDTHMTL